MRMRNRKLIMILTIVFALSALFALSACGNKPQPDAAAQKPDQTQGSGDAGAEPKQKSWDKSPEMTIDPNKQYTATFKTSKGEFKVQLFAKDAPITVNNFVFLAKEGFYNGVIFHRIIDTYMIQTGDPQGTGAGGPGYTIQDELNGPHKYEVGTVAMAKTTEPNSAGSQFFIGTGKDIDNLNMMPDYPIFGKVTEGMDTVQKIAKTPTEYEASGREKSSPTEKVTIDSIEIEEK